MQFQYNSDYPEAATPTSPLDFPAAQPVPCARITTRIFHPKRQQVATVQNVLVRTRRSRPVDDADDDSSMSSNFSDSSDDASMKDTASNTPLSTDDSDDRAYWIQRTIREAIYGRVFFAIVLKRRTGTTGMPNDNAEWEVTERQCAVKEMSWQHIRRERDRLAEDPIKEVSAMQYLHQWFNRTVQEQIDGLDGVERSFQAMSTTNIIMPLDLLSDDRNLYSIMPFCDGGELFERLDLNERFPEAEARYWMRQILNGVETLQNAGICHRDMSLENLLVHQNGALVIDLGMCLRVPFLNAATVADVSQSMGAMNMNGGTSAANSATVALPINGSNRQTPRALISPQGTCGKWIYMSPEIYRNKDAFDGFTVDMWAVGVILFLMLTGFPPWERACQTDERFKYMTAGYLVQMLTEWDIGLSPDAMDLLQRMLFLDPKDRLGLDQVRAHPWMANGPVQSPLPERPGEFR